MNSFDEAPAGSRAGTARAVFDAWRGITPSQVKGAFLFGCALWAYHFIVYANSIFTHFPDPVRRVTEGFFREQLGAYVLLLALVATDRLIGGHPRRRGPYAVAVLITATLYAPLQTAMALRFQFGPIELVKWTLYYFFEWLVLAGVATFIYTDVRRARTARARKHAAEVERAHAARRTLESRLQAMQARVEPRFLFNTLAQVRGLYRSSAARGERMLEELIAYLRAAMPRMRDTSSTVGQEVHLVRAYLGVVSLGLGERLAFEIRASARSEDARMPPMMLLPLIDHAIARNFADAESTGSIRVRSAISDETVRIEIVDSGAGFLPGTDDDEIAGIRERLSALYGSDGSLVLRRKGASESEAVLQFRHEPAVVSVAGGP